ncbi:PD-(D/E)XK nuclease-like domain-containing protein [Nonomuraea gerenzanensis]|uniref:Phage exonuclease n=1 Tax=Nonomuraea gerenzanensis TaxID=93944 RepID=A0A1M4BKX7_9ACTN|nr:PD-(D/E)XK nuclease-like domain-containing protein [Nonomuraea gerenzanensis]UBU09995.1 PD-(D/E)XK nuclease-like domain-containing protein [Nonomuraea gerenzanensis]SAP16296.1 Phage exonuclease [Nonomuraea gerenzanensis]
MTAVEAPPLGAGVHDIPHDAYISDPVSGGSLSSTGARKLLQPGGPAKFRWEKDHPEPPRKTFDLGHAAHQLVLGAGPELELIPADEWRTKEIKAQVARARERGAVPLRPADWQMVHGMADAIRRHPVASRLFEPGAGQAEQSLIWQDSESGVWRRARPDWLRPGTDRLICCDYKTTISAADDAIAKTVANLGYHQQDAWYVDGLQALGLDDQPAFLFVLQEKAPPYLIRIVQLDPDAEWAGRRLNRRAIDIYAACTATGIWPGYDPEIGLISLPRWASIATFEESL